MISPPAVIAKRSTPVPPDSWNPFPSSESPDDVILPTASVSSASSSTDSAEDVIVAATSFMSISTVPTPAPLASFARICRVQLKS